MIVVGIKNDEIKASSPFILQRNPKLEPDTPHNTCSENII
jgi:hypothetical protein